MMSNLLFVFLQLYADLIWNLCGAALPQILLCPREARRSPLTRSTFHPVTPSSLCRSLSSSGTRLIPSSFITTFAT